MLSLTLPEYHSVVHQAYNPVQSYKDHVHVLLEKFGHT